MPAKATAKTTTKATAKAKGLPDQLKSAVRVTHATELMYTYRHACPVPGPQMFKAVEDGEGASLLLAIDKGRFSCIRETSTDALGWVQSELGSEIGKDFPGKTPRAKMFDVAQDRATRSIDLALVVSVDDADYLYVSFDNPAPDAPTAFRLVWRAATLQDPGIQTSAGAAPFVIADLVGLPSLVGKLLKPARPIDRWLASLLDAKDQAVLASSPGGDPRTVASRLTVVLNARVSGESLYEVRRFDGVSLRDVTQELLRRGAAIGNDLAYLNRLLLEDAYPAELARNRYQPGPIRICSVTLANPRQGPKSIVVDMERGSASQVKSIARFVVVPRPGPTSAGAKAGADWNYYPLPPEIGAQPPTYRESVSSAGRPLSMWRPAFTTLVTNRAATGDGIVTLRKMDAGNGVSILPLDFNRAGPYPAATEFYAMRHRRVTAVATSQAPGTNELSSDLLLVDEPMELPPPNAATPSGPPMQPALWFHSSDASARKRCRSVCEHLLFAQTRSLHVHNTASVTVLLGLTRQRELYCLQCPAGSEGDAEAWSSPVLIQDEVNGIACPPRTRDDGATVVFASKSGQDGSRLVQLIRDTRTNLWQLRPVLVASTNPEDLYPTVRKIADDWVDHGEGGVTFSTRIKVTDRNGLPIPNLNLEIESSSPCSVLINRRYYRLSDSPTVVPTDALGALNIEQEVDTLGAVCYRLRTPPDRPIWAPLRVRFSNRMVINPMSGTLDRLGAVRSAADLPSPSSMRAARGSYGSYTFASGTISPDPAVLERQRAVTAQAIVQFVELAKTMPANGSLQPATRSARAASAPGEARHFGITYTPRGAVFHRRPPATQKSSVGKFFKHLAGDALRMLKRLIDKVESFVVSVVNEVIQFTFTIAGEIIQFAVRCLHEIMHGIDFVLRKVGISLEAVVKWIGHLFGWDDIVQNQKVLAKMVSAYIDHCVSDLDKLGQRVSDTIDSLAGTVRKWGGKPGLSGGTGPAYDPASPPADFGLELPSVHWAFQTFVHHIPHLEVSCPALDGPVTTAIQDAIRALADQLKQDWGSFKQASLEMADLVKALPTLPLSEVLKKVLSLLTVDLLNLTKNGLLLAVKLFRILGSLMRRFFDAPVHIPVFSRLYREFVGGELTLLNLTCLVGAIPLTLIGKAVTGHDPLRPYARGVLRASGFAGIQAVFASEYWPRSRAAGMTLDDSGTSAPRTGKGPTMQVKGLVKIANILGFVGGTLVALTMPVKVAASAAPAGENGVPVLPSLGLGIGLGVANVLYNMPSLLSVFAPEVDPTSPVGGMAVANAVIAGLAVTKVLIVDMGLSLVKAGLSLTGPPWSVIGPLVIDFVSCHLDFVINFLWLTPTVGAIIVDPNTPNGMNFAGGMLFDFGGLISPLFWDAQAVVLLGQVVAAAFVETVETGVGVIGVLVGAGVWAGGATALTVIGGAQGFCAAGCAGLLFGSSYVHRPDEPAEPTSPPKPRTA